MLLDLNKTRRTGGGKLVTETEGIGAHSGHLGLYGCSKWPRTRPQASRNRRHNSFHPPSPSCQDSSFLVWGTLRISCESRTKLGHWRVLARLGRAGDKAGVFSIRYSETGMNCRIHAPKLPGFRL
jgi:hypothetical protein